MSKANVISPQKCNKCGATHNIAAKSIRTNDGRVICPKCSNVHTYKFVVAELKQGSLEMIQAARLVWELFALADVMQGKIIDMLEKFNFGDPEKLVTLKNHLDEMQQMFDTLTVDSEKHCSSFDKLKKEVEKLSKNLK